MFMFQGDQSWTQLPLPSSRGVQIQRKPLEESQLSRAAQAENEAEHMIYDFEYTYLCYFPCGSWPPQHRHETLSCTCDQLSWFFSLWGLLTSAQILALRAGILDPVIPASMAVHREGAGSSLPRVCE